MIEMIEHNHKNKEKINMANNFWEQESLEITKLQLSKRKNTRRF